jgi:hypothetical protein
MRSTSMMTWPFRKMLRELVGEALDPPLAELDDGRCQVPVPA